MKLNAQRILRFGTRCAGIAMLVIIALLAVAPLAGSATAQDSLEGENGDVLVADDELVDGDIIGDDGAEPAPTQTCVEEGENLGTLTSAGIERSGELSTGDCRDAIYSYWNEGWVDRFTFELSAPATLRIDLDSTGDSGRFSPALSLREVGREIAGVSHRGGNVSLWRDLDAGTYEIVATLSGGGGTAPNRHLYRLTASLSPPCEPERLSIGAAASMSGGMVSRTGEFATSGCVVETWYQTFGPGAVYTFELAEPRPVQIDLQGLDGVNSYLKLKREDQSWYRATDDDAGPGRDASIQRNLEAGEWRIEAGYVGDGADKSRYRLTLAVGAPPSCEEDQLGLIHGDVVRTGEFGADGCLTIHRWYSSPYWGGLYTFSLAEPGRVLIDLEGIDGVNPTLELLDDQGDQVASDLDGGPGRDARIERELAAGTYRINVQRSDGYQGEPGGQYRLTIDAASQPVPISLTGRIVVRRLADGRTEFNWLPRGATERILPARRYLGPNAQVDRWFSSSPIEVGGTAIGRINVKLLADGRIEFAFTPTGGRMILPTSRILPAEPEVDRWLRSSEIELPGSDR